MTDEINKEERAEARLLRHLRHSLKHARKLRKVTAKEESAIKKNSEKEELKFTKEEEKDLFLLFRDYILEFRDLVRIMKHLEHVEKEQGKKEVQVHDEYKSKIMRELNIIHQQLSQITHVERR
ncbi:MAG: hypothetical protein ACQESC_03350 [Nanobdellota archaeon]